MFEVDNIVGTAGSTATEAIKARSTHGGKGLPDQILSCLKDDLIEENNLNTS
jgi:hypothetical protein